MNYVALGNRIKNKRLSQKLTQEKLAEMVDLSAVYIGQIERAERHLSIGNLVKLANALNCAIDELLKESTMNNKNAKLYELVEVARELSPKNIEKIIEVIKVLYW